MQKPAKETGLKRFWKVVVPSRSESSADSGGEDVEGGRPPCSLPLLQVWPSQDSPRGEADGQSFIFPPEESSNPHDSGIESVQESPSPVLHHSTTPKPGKRRQSSGLLHPDHARLMARPPLSPTLSLDQERISIDEPSEPVINGIPTSASSSASSLASVAAAGGSRASDPLQDRNRRRSSTVTARYSLLDALDLEYALIRAAARGSIGPYSLSESLHKLTFTQSLAFPALARGLANKRRSSSQNPSRNPLDPNDTGLNAFAKVTTALVLVLISILVFGVVYKFVRT